MSNETQQTGNICPACGQSFVCGAEAGLATCWCMEAPSGLFTPEADSSCYCPTCLRQKIEEVRQKAAAGDPKIE